MPILALIAGYTIVGLVGLLGLAIIWLIFTSKIKLELLLSEKEPGTPASMSRFQFLVFTFVVAVCFLILTLESGEFPKVDVSILGLLGVSGTSYLVSKGIQRARPQGTLLTHEGDR